MIVKIPDSLNTYITENPIGFYLLSIITIAYSAAFLVYRADPIILLGYVLKSCYMAYSFSI